MISTGEITIPTGELFVPTSYLIFIFVKGTVFGSLLFFIYEILDLLRKKDMFLAKNLSINLIFFREKRQLDFL